MCSFACCSDKGFSWSGSGQSVFGKVSQGGEEAEGDDEVQQGPDIHFEPIAQLPEFVEVKTGEWTPNETCHCFQFLLMWPLKSLKDNSTMYKTEAQIVSYGVLYLNPSSHQCQPSCKKYNAV